MDVYRVVLKLLAAALALIYRAYSFSETNMQILDRCILSSGHASVRPSVQPFLPAQ